MTQDIHGNILKEGEFVYALTSARVGVQYKRLFAATVVETTSTSKAKVNCHETNRIVSLTSQSLIKPQDY